MRNLLVAGRSVGGDAIAHAMTRNTACCVVTGQGAGAAAAGAVRSGLDVGAVAPRAVQAELERQGVRLR